MNHAGNTPDRNLLSKSRIQLFLRLLVTAVQVPSKFWLTCRIFVILYSSGIRKSRATSTSLANIDTKVCGDISISKLRKHTGLVECSVSISFQISRELSSNARGLMQLRFY